MKKGNSFYFFFILTILIIRITIIFIPNVDVKLSNFVIHHLVFGFLILIFYLFFIKHRKWIDSLVIGSGLGLIIDQVIFVLLSAGGDEEYWALPSLIGVIVLAMLIFFIRKHIVKYYLNLKEKTKRFNII